MSPARRTRHTSRPNIALFALFAAIWQVGPAQAENAKPAPASLRRLFPSEADLLTDREGLARVDLPPELLAACRPDLSDLRIFDNDGREVPFLMDRLAPPASGYEMTQRFNAPVLEVARTEIRREKGPPLRRETYDVGLPGVASRTGSWTLIIETDRPEFVCRVSVAGLPSAGKSVSLIENASFFRISGSRPAERLRLPLPIFAGRGLRISLEGEEARYLEPGFRLESARILETPTRISVPLEIVSTENENGATIIELARPRGIVPDLLHIDTSTGTFNRRIEAWDLGQGVPLAPIGEEAIFRVRAIAAVEQADVTLKPARGERLRLRIENGDSPPLEGLAVTAIVRRPSLVFDARPDRSGVAGTLCFGGGRARLPRYDLSGLLPAREEAATGRRAEAAALLVDPASIARSWIGPVRPNPSFDRSPALAFAMRPGAGSETGLYSHRRTLEVAPSPEGLSRMRLAPADLAHLREDLADLRVVDAKSRQWPYLLERDAAVELVALQVESRESKDGVSRYRLALPVVPLRIDGLRFDAEAPFFDRDFRLAARLEEEKERTLLEARFVRKMGADAPIEANFPATRVEGLELIVQDGDDAPLIFRSVGVRVTVPEIYLAAPQGSYLLLLGSPGDSAPRYELARARDVVLAVAAAPVRAGDLSPNPDFSLPARLAKGGLRQQVLLWSVLGAAVIVLAALTLRLARKESIPREGKP